MIILHYNPTLPTPQPATDIVIISTSCSDVAAGCRSFSDCLTSSHMPPQPCPQPPHPFDHYAYCIGFFLEALLHRQHHPDSVPPPQVLHHAVCLPDKVVLGNACAELVLLQWAVRYCPPPFSWRTPPSRPCASARTGACPH
jgi:hypothetical protein